MLEASRTRIQSAGWLALRCGMVAVIAALPLSIAVMNMGLVLAWAGALVARAPVHRTVGFWWGVAYAGWQIVSRLIGLVEGRDVGGGFGSAYTWTGLCLAQVAFQGNEAGAVRARMAAIVGLLTTTAAATLVSLGQFVIGRLGSAKPLRIDPTGQRFSHATGFFAIHLTYGVIMMLILLAAVGGAFRSWWSWRPWPWILGALAAIGLALSLGRLAFLGIAVGMAAMLACRGRRYLVTALVVGLGLLLVGGTLVAVLQPARFERMMRLEDGRWPIWRTSMALVHEHPLVGTGSSRAYREAYREHYETVNPGQWNEFPLGAPHAHNAPLALAAEHGLPAALLWCLLIIVVVVGCRPLRGGPVNGFPTAVALSAAFLAASQFEHLAGDGESCHAVWSLLGALLAQAPSREVA